VALLGPRRKTFAIGWAAGLATAGVIAAIWVGLILSGLSFDTRATKPHSRVFAWGIHQTMIHSVKRNAARTNVAIPVDPASALAGAREYEAHCVECHGGPGVERATWVRGMLPTPPYLLDARARWSRAELYTLVHDGVKMTGMPAWGRVMSDRQVAEVVAFLEVMPSLTPDQFDRVRKRVRADPSAQRQ
jgi:mono/diheme cytochrome c family protein